jgi:hypothetical protein
MLGRATLVTPRHGWAWRRAMTCPGTRSSWLALRECCGVITAFWQPPGHGGDPAFRRYTAGARAPDLQPGLGELPAPGEYQRWSELFDDLDSCWDACPDAAWLLWAAARTGPHE